MIRRNIVSLVLLVLMCPLTAYAAKVEFAASVRAKTPATLGIPPEGVAVRAVKPYKADRGSMKERASATFRSNPIAAGVKGITATESENDRAVQFMSGQVEFEISKAAGAEILMDLSRYTHLEKGGPAIEENALQRDARRYISSYMPDIDPKEVSFKGIKKIMDSVARVAKDNKQSEMKTGVANYIVMFQRRIDNVPVVGPGESIRVYLSSKGDVIGHSRVWRDVNRTPAAPRPVVPPERIQETVRRSLAEHPAPTVSVDYFEFGYLAEGRYTAQDALRPVYLVGYKAGPETKRAIRIYDAYTGQEIPPPADPAGGDRKAK